MFVLMCFYARYHRAFSGSCIWKSLPGRAGGGGHDGRMSLPDRPVETDAAPPLASACVVVLRDGPQGLQTLLARRHSETADLGGACVFPGGKVDAADRSDEALACLDEGAQGGQPHLAARLAEPDLPASEAAALHLAAAREALEEAGLLYARPDCAAGIAADFMSVMSDLRQGAPFAAALAARGLRLHWQALHPWARWITPEQTVLRMRRFDTRFFLAELPAGQTPAPDGREAVELLWRTPRQALAQYAEGRITLAPPQIMSLLHLARHASAASALAQARQRPPPCIRPQVLRQAEGVVFVYPGDAQYRDDREYRAGAGLPPGLPTRLEQQGALFVPPGGFEPWLMA